MKKQSKTCYMCEAAKMSRDHAPPRCIFPDEAQYRTNLITVPSCAKHNLQKSGDDEYLRHVLVASPTGNNLNMKVLESVMRSWRHRPALLPTFLPDLREVQIGAMKTGAYRVDVPRFNRAVEAVVRGLYYHDMREKLLCKLSVEWGALITPSLELSPFFHLIQAHEQILPPLNRGQNPRIFRYGWWFENNRQNGLCRLSFYEGHPIWAVWQTTASA